MTTTTFAVCHVTAGIIRYLPEIGPTTDSGKRIFKNQIVKIHGKSLDGNWYFVDAPAAKGWVSKSLLVPADEPHQVTPAWPKVPKGHDGIEAMFGKAGTPICHSGRVKFPEPLKLSWDNEKVTVVACHKLLEDVFQSVFDTIHAKGLWSLLKEYGGIYEYRETRGAQKLSCHAWGIAIDLNPVGNGLGDTTPAMDKRLIQIFKDHGFLWGGDFAGRKDPMHFQYATGY